MKEALHGTCLFVYFFPWIHLPFLFQSIKDHLRACTFHSLDKLLEASELKSATMRDSDFAV
jgi:hypothetical protein